MSFLDPQEHQNTNICPYLPAADEWLLSSESSSTIDITLCLPLPWAQNNVWFSTGGFFGE